MAFLSDELCASMGAVRATRRQLRHALEPMFTAFEEAVREKMASVRKHDRDGLWTWDSHDNDGNAAEQRRLMKELLRPERGGTDRDLLDAAAKRALGKLPLAIKCPAKAKAGTTAALKVCAPCLACVRACVPACLRACLPARCAALRGGGVQ